MHFILGWRNTKPNNKNNKVRHFLFSCFRCITAQINYTRIFITNTRTILYEKSFYTILYTLGILESNMTEYEHSTYLIEEIKFFIIWSMIVKKVLNNNSTMAYLTNNKNVIITYNLTSTKYFSCAIIFAYYYNWIVFHICKKGDYI